MNKWIVSSILSAGLLASPMLGAFSSAQAALPDFTELVDQQSAAVVNITTSQEIKTTRRGRNNQPPSDMFEFFKRFGLPEGPGMPGVPSMPENGRHPPKQGQGSGFIISHDGYVLTNAHVVDDADEVVVKLNDKREFRAKVIGSDERTDIALIKIPAERLPRVAIGNPDRLRVGEWVLAIGAPFGFENSVTAGIVSAKGRALPQENYVPFIQTDVAVNPGNSGGPLFNMRGEVVGVNSQIISRSGGYMGLSFAIPIDVAMDVAEQLKGGGKVSRGRLGVLIQEVTADLADSFGLGKPHGALVSEVEPDSPADKAGIRASDIILRFEGRPIEASIDLPRMVGATKPGTKVNLTVWRKGEKREFTAVLAAVTDDKTGSDKPEKTPNKAGLAVSPLAAEQKKQLKIESGVLVDDVVGAAARAGIRIGDVIVAAGNLPVNSADELARLLNDKDRKSIALLVKRGDGSLYIPLRLD